MMPRSTDLLPAKKSVRWVLYIMECGDKTLYTGITNDLPNRFAKHQAGTGARYTRGRGPLRIVYREKCDDKSSALKREHAVKKLTRMEKLGLVEKVRKQKRPALSPVEV